MIRDQNKKWQDKKDGVFFTWGNARRILSTACTDFCLPVYITITALGIEMPAVANTSGRDPSPYRTGNPSLRAACDQQKILLSDDSNTTQESRNWTGGSFGAGEGPIMFLFLLCRGFYIQDTK